MTILIVFYLLLLVLSAHIVAISYFSIAIKKAQKKFWAVVNWQLMKVCFWLTLNKRARQSNTVKK